MFVSRLIRWLLPCTILCGSIAYAQSVSPTLVHQLQLPVGAVFEVMPVGTEPTDTYVWSLRRGDLFLQAGRNRLFRTRMIEKGSYLLSAEISDASGEPRYKKEFQIQITDSPAQVPESDLGSSGSLLIRSDPPRNANGATVAASHVDIITLTPQKQTDKKLVLDTKPQIDSDGDGDPRNDQEALDSFFSLEQAPLVLWFPDRSAVTSLAIAIDGDAGSTEILRLITREEAVQEEKEKQGVRINAVRIGSGAVRFSVTGDTSALGEVDSLLYQWDFGDGNQSMLHLPVHNYEKNGSYEVLLDVRNLRTGSVAESFTATVQVSSVSIRGPTAPTADGDVPDSDDGAGTSSWVSGWNIIKLLIGLVIAAVIGFLIIMIIRMLQSKGGVKNVLQKAESALMDSKEEDKVVEGNIVDAPAAPLVVEEEQEIEQPKPDEPPPAKEEVQEAAPPPPPVATSAKPSAQDAQAPDWLQKGMKQASATGQTMSTPPPEPLRPMPDNPVAPKQKPDAIPMTAAQPEPQTPPAPATQSDTPLPPWLQDQASDAQEPATPAPASPTPTPTPPAAPEPTSEPAPEQFTTPAPAPTTDVQEKPQTPEEKERAKKREKRRRYRKNKREREKSEDAQPEKPAQEVQTTTSPVAPQITEPVKEEVPPVPQPIPLQEESVTDDDVKFVIGADSVTEQEQSPPEEHHTNEGKEEQKQ